MNTHHTINAPLSQPPRFRFAKDMPADDSSLDVSDAWLEQTGEDAIVTAYFRHYPDDHGGEYASMIGLRVKTDTALDLYTKWAAQMFLGAEAYDRIEAVQTQAIADGVA